MPKSTHRLWHGCCSSSRHAVRVRLPPGLSANVIRVFLSSGDDLLDLRELTDALVRDAVNAVLMQAQVHVRLEIDRWERTAPHRLRPGQHANADFVARAREAHVVMCLLLDELGDGTREELEAAARIAR
jgi:hypothetical protein